MRPPIRSPGNLGWQSSANLQSLVGLVGVTLDSTRGIIACTPTWSVACASLSGYERK